MTNSPSLSQAGCSSTASRPPSSRATMCSGISASASAYTGAAHATHTCNRTLPITPTPRQVFEPDSQKEQDLRQPRRRHCQFDEPLPPRCDALPPQVCSDNSNPTLELNQVAFREYSPCALTSAGDRTPRTVTVTATGILPSTSLPHAHHRCALSGVRERARGHPSRVRIGPGGDGQPHPRQLRGRAGR